MRISLGFQPNPRQLEFFKARARHICYGGARGGGKSWAMRTKFILLALKYPGLRLLLLRRTLGELRQNHVLPLISSIGNIARYNSTNMEFNFPNGSMIKLGYCEAEKDINRYQGHEYDVIGMEEATHFTEEQMRFFTTCLRNIRTDFNPRMYYTCNPGGVGHAWVKRLFIDRQYMNKERAENYAFIPARVFDNYVLMSRNPDYVEALENLPEDMRRAHLYGDWDVYAGQFFPEFRRMIHVVEPFVIPGHWNVYRGIDYGLDMLACYWAAFDESGNGYIFREHCAPNVVVSDAARKIVDLSNELAICTYAPADLWGRSRDSGVAQAETFAQNGLPLTRVCNSRADSWMNLKEWIKPLGSGPKLKIFSTCRELIRCLPLLQHDEKNPCDCATQPHDITHAPDAVRYLLDGRPYLARVIQPHDEFDPPEYDDQVDAFLNYGH